MSANGKLADNELTTVDGWARLTPATARAYLAAAAYVLLHFGIRFVISSPDGAYRSLASQIAVKKKYGVLAATPGYSNHGLGLAFDINNILAVAAAVGGIAQLEAIMARFGFIRDAPNGTGGIELWHFRLVATVDLSALEGATELHDPIPEPPKEDVDMIHYLATSNSTNGMIGTGQRFVQGVDGVLRCLGGGEWAAIVVRSPELADDSRTVKVGGDQFLELITRVGLYEYTVDKGQPGGVGRLTGRIIYTAAEARPFPKVQIGS